MCLYSIAFGAYLAEGFTQKTKQNEYKMLQLETIEYEIINSYGEWKTVTVYEWIETETEKTEKE